MKDAKYWEQSKLPRNHRSQFKPSLFPTSRHSHLAGYPPHDGDLNSVTQAYKGPRDPSRVFQSLVTQTVLGVRRSHLMDKSSVDSLLNNKMKNMHYYTDVSTPKVTDYTDGKTLHGSYTHHADNTTIP